MRMVDMGMVDKGRVTEGRENERIGDRGEERVMEG